MSEVVRIQRALISVSEKQGLEPLLRALVSAKVEILSSGGTAKFIADLGLPVREVSSYTGAPEMLDGRVKTLHPKIHGGLLALRNNPQHMKELESQGYLPIDLVVVNLYPFEKALQSEEKSKKEMIEQIDIGGPSMLRSAAKNHEFVTVLLEPSQYESFLKNFQAHQQGTTLEYRMACARRVFERTAAYDAAIASYFQQGESKRPEHYSLALEQKWSLRYGENPHQEAGFYLPSQKQGGTFIEKVLQGKALSYNNMLDIHGALDLITELEDRMAVAILKHTNPCGVGISFHSLAEAYARALSCDPVSAFGGILIFSRPLDGKTAEEASKTFTEIVIAPGFDSLARETFSKKKNVRLLEIDLTEAKAAMSGFDVRRVVDGYLVQDRDRAVENLQRAKVVTKRSPDSSEMEALTLAWTVAKHVKSNAIVLTNETQTIGIGAGQMSRVDSTRIATLKADPEKLKGAVLASDAFFPFRDGIDEAARHGIRAIVQPGGSVKDEEVIQAANEHNLAMIFTGIRHFRH